MKKILLICLFSFHVNAGDLIFKQGFENTGLVSGTVTGLSSTGLSINLNVSPHNEILIINENGVFTFFMDVPVGSNYQTNIVTLPSTPQQQNCTLSNQNGTMPTTGANTLIITCNNDAWNWNEMDWNSGGWN